MSKTLLLLSLLLMSTISYGQNCNPPAADDCENSYVLCGLSELDGYACSNPDISNPTGPFPTLCFGQGVSHNTNWWAFVGNGSRIEVTFEFNPKDCEFAGTSCNGIQAGIVLSCGGPPLDCNAACNTSTFTLSGVTESCHTYYVWVDGCCGDVCSYEISVGQGNKAKIPLPLPEFEVKGEKCLCNEVEVCIGDLAGSCQAPLRWTIDGEPMPDFEDWQCINMPVPESPAEVCVTWLIGNPRNPDAICDEQTKCFTLSADSIQTVRLRPETLCYEVHQEQYTWGIHGVDTTIESSCVDPPCVLFAQTGTGCCVRYEKEFTLLPKRDTGIKWVFHCDDSPYIDENRRGYNQPVCDSPVTWTAPYGAEKTLCDTTYKLYFDRYNPKVEAHYTFNRAEDTAFVSASFEWAPNCIHGIITEVPAWVTPDNDTIWEPDFTIRLDTAYTGGRYDFYIKVIYEDTSDVRNNDTCFYNTGKFKFIPKKTTGLKPQSNASEPPFLRVFPNPADAHFFIEYDGASSTDGALSIYHSDGLCILTREYTIRKIGALLKIDCSHCVPGLYYVVLRRNGQETIQKLVISR